MASISGVPALDPGWARNAVPTAIRIPVPARPAARPDQPCALLNMAGSDAFVASWDAKYTYNQWRPVTAIRAADTDGNPNTAADPTWTPLLPTPPFPDHIAGHTTFAGAAEVVLARIFGPDPGTFSLVSAATPGVVHTFGSFGDVATEVVNARVWAGIHWRTSAETGRRVGDKVGAWALAHAPERE